MTDPRSKLNRRNVLKKTSTVAIGAAGLAAGAGSAAAADCGCGYSESDSFTLDSDLTVYDDCNLSEYRDTWDAGDEVTIGDCAACDPDEVLLDNSTINDWGIADCDSI